MTYSTVANTPFEQVFDTPIVMILTALRWKKAENKREEQRIKQWKATH